MEGSPEQKPPIASVSNSTTVTNPRSHKGKKKSAVAKLAERKRRSSESGSEFGSSLSLQSTDSKVTIETKSNKDTINKKSNGDIKGQNDSLIDQSKDTETITPKLAPRSKGVAADKAELSPPNYMDIDSDSEEEKNPESGDIISKKAPSDATVHRFRALKVANDQGNSLKNSPFVPKPPQTPRSARSISQKGEKRNREAGSSGEEAEIEVKSKKQSSPTSLDSPKLNKNVNKSNELLIQKKLEKVKQEKDQTMSSETDLKEISKEYQNLVNADSLGPDSVVENNNLFGSGQVTPRSSKLPPLSPKSHPPPLAGDVSSRSLRTAYKTDTQYPFNRTMDYSKKNSFDSISQHSLSSTSIMPLIPIKEARARVGSTGNVTATSSLIGSDELDRYFPDRRVRVWVGTWNMGDIKYLMGCKNSLQDFLLPEDSNFVQDIYAIGTQENNVPKKEWEVQIQETLGPSHVLFHSTTHGALHLAIYIRRDLIWFCSVPEDDQVTTRAVTMVKTKGGCAISFTFFGTSFLFVNCHFTSDDGRIKERIADYQRISSGDISSKIDAVFWFGDLNFRIEKGRHPVEDLVHAIVSQDHPNFEDLLQNDELKKCILQEQIFNGFQEGRINFKPTYKFDINSDRYDTSAKNRIPSYTDRVLFRAKKKNTVSCSHYDAVTSLKLSDHRPVYGLYEVAIKPGRENIQLAAGQFDRDVYVEANKRRALQHISSTPSQKSSVFNRYKCFTQALYEVSYEFPKIWPQYFCRVYMYSRVMYLVSIMVFIAQNTRPNWNMAKRECKG
ncbi:hypothetical protein KUTeg_022041 [Tegillarca granosa]|uniref:Inositol polyphosphate-related phosphatase domain-containing protein n=1 Tax=Tegillarca granosa TaxID=220873 RepID=A0ABQ9EAE2_TEGGR|nr:hypothetical protein KUTeg_022041 [Tegillarca granosa]